MLKRLKKKFETVLYLKIMQMVDISTYVAARLFSILHLTILLIADFYLYEFIVNLLDMFVCLNEGKMAIRTNYISL